MTREKLDLMCDAIHTSFHKFGIHPTGIGFRLNHQDMALVRLCVPMTSVQGIDGFDISSGFTYRSINFIRDDSKR